MKSSKLSREEEIALFKAGRSDEVVVAHGPLARRMAYRFANGRTRLIDDLCQAAFVGLTIAASKYDPSRGARFSTYAIYWIGHEIRNHLRVARKLVVAPHGREIERAKMVMIANEAESAEELAAVANVTPEIAEAAFRLFSSVELQTERQLEGGGVVEWLESDSDPEREVGEARDSVTRRAAIERALLKLAPRERQVIEIRWLGDEQPTLQSVGEQIGVSKQRVDQAERDAFRKLSVILRQCA